MDKIWRNHKMWVMAGAGAAMLVLFLVYWHVTAKERVEDRKKTEALFSEMSQEKDGSSSSEAESKVKDNREEEETVKPAQEVVVDLKGAVKIPGIYRVKDSDRVNDVIHQAGGLTGKADRDKVNFAQKVSDEMVIYVPEKGERDVPAVAGTSAGGAASSPASPESGQSKVNINTADEQEMQNLPGIGEVKAKTIIAYREEHGPFKTVDELTNVSGIGEKSLEKIKPMATVD
ncbi:competence protein ComEA [Sporolactobacillus sp. THM7-7]|nr:competence protein ComEA [Sporolactobacillus sp. THM7-7]